MAVLHIRQSPGGIAETASGVKSTLTSWDGCMSKTYCKWPVIAGIIVGSLILLSILWCFARCLCCGAECACCCFRCCAGCCGGGGRNKQHKHLDSVPATPYRGAPPPGAQAWNQQYQSAPQPSYQSQSGFHQPAAPQFATFDASTKKPIHEDSLPAMPSWENAANKKIEVVEEPETHEMDKLNSQNNYSTATLPAVTAPTPMRPGGPGSPFSEHESFLSGGAYTQSSMYVSQPGTGHADSYAGYRDASASPAQLGYNSQQYGGNQQHVVRFNEYSNGPVPPQYAPLGSTAQEIPSNKIYSGYNQQGSTSPYGAGRSPYGGGQPSRKPLNGSWRDV